ncbi:hypothetical protein Ddc_16438 [Ditylenchus destructor]|nr:hypothetical protein Ddc_16438 [Ditylenchus destructor]
MLKDGHEIDKEELVKFLKFEDTETKIKAVDFYKKIKHPNIGETETGCEHKLPSQSIDKDTIDLVDKEMSHEVVENLESKYSGSVISNAFHWGAVASHELNSGLMVYYFIKHVDEAINDNNYKPMLVDTGIYVMEYWDQINMAGKKYCKAIN